jgi:predicted transcriptional regulator of viral defense system
MSFCKCCGRPFEARIGGRRVTKAWVEIKAALREAGVTTIPQVAENTGTAYFTIHHEMLKLERRGEVERVGKRGNANLWRARDVAAVGKAAAP